MPETTVENVTVHNTFPNADAQLDEVVDLAPVVIKESKDGYRTTEFWVAIAAALATQFDVTSLPEKVQGYVVGAIAVAYVISRGIAKKGVPAVEVTEA